VLVDGAVLAGNGRNESAVDLAQFALGAALQSGGCQAVDISEFAVGGLVKEGDGIGREELACGTGRMETMLEIFSGVRWSTFGQLCAGVDARPKGAVLTKLESASSLGEADQNDG